MQCNDENRSYEARKSKVIRFFFSLLVVDSTTSPRSQWLSTFAMLSTDDMLLCACAMWKGFSGIDNTSHRIPHTLLQHTQCISVYIWIMKYCVDTLGFSFLEKKKERESKKGLSFREVLLTIVFLDGSSVRIWQPPHKMIY